MGPRSTKSKRVTLRGIWVQVHLWLGLTLGVVGALVGLSGSVLAYDHEIVTWQRTLHEGSAFGPVWRFVTFLGGLLPPLLVATGLLIWLRSRNRRRSVAALNLSAETSR